MSENRTRPAPAWRRKHSYTEGENVLCGFCFAFFDFLGKIFRKWLTIRGIAGIITPVVRHGTNIWGISSAGSPVGIKTHPQSDGPATINSQQKTPSKRFASWILWGISSAGRALAWHARGHRFDPGILHQKSTVLRLKYGAFLFDFLEATEKISQKSDFAGAWTATPNSCCFVVFENTCSMPDCFAGGRITPPRCTE